MPDYEKLYHLLVGDISDAIDLLKRIVNKAEDMYMDMCEEEFPNGEDLEHFECDDEG